MANFYNLSRPLDEYLIGKYTNGQYIYLIGKEAYNTWKGAVSVKHLYIGKTETDTYPLSVGAKYSAYEFKNISAEWKQLMQDTCPNLLKELTEFYPSAEPAPDQFYIAQGNNTLLYSLFYCNKGEYDVYSSERWDGIGTTKTCLNSCKQSPLGYKKFSQLSSDEKAELQRLNPERYKAWEEFYMQKYPVFQPLNPQAYKPTELPDPADDYVVVSEGGLTLCKRSEFEHGALRWNYSFNVGWRYSRVTTGDLGCPAWPFIKDWRGYKGIDPIYDRFEQYYTQLEQNPLKFKGLLEQAKDVRKRDPQAHDNFVFLFKEGEYFITEMVNRHNRHYTNVGIWKSVHTAIVTPIECDYLGTFEQLRDKDRVRIQKLNPERYTLWFAYYNKPESQVWGKNTIPGTYGSDYDIDKQQNYTPNLKQQNNAPINVQRKTATVSRGQNLTGHSIQSQRSQPSVATGHPQYRPRVVCVKTKPGSCQIGLSV
jgi:hypothetical protein